jgi:hypothetical protein
MQQRITVREAVFPGRVLSDATGEESFEAHCCFFLLDEDFFLRGAPDRLMLKKIAS